MNQVRAALILAATDLRRRVRNRSFVIQAIVGPIALASIISLAFGSSGIDVTLGVVDADGSPMSAQLAEGLEQVRGEGLEVRSVDSVAEARDRVDGGDLDAALVVPEGFSAALTSARPVDLEVLTSSDNSLAGEVGRAVASGVTERADAARLAVATSSALGTPPPSGRALAAIEPPVAIETRGTGGDVSPAAYFGPGMGLLFLFLSVGTMARDLLAEERTGLIARLRAGPVGDPAILVGRGLGVVALGVASLSVIWAVTGVALGADWGDPAGVVLLIVAASLSVAGIAGLIAGAARTEQQAETMSSAAAFTFALLGGTFIPLGQLPGPLQVVALFTPTGWALRGFAELSAGEGTVIDVVPHVLVLLIWALVTGVVAARLLPRRLEGR